MTKNRVHTVYKLILSLALIAAGVCLMIACLGIYLSGNKPFSPESVAAAFTGIAVPVYLCIALVIGGFVLDIFYPAEQKKQPAEKQYALILSRLQQKLDMENCDAETRQAIVMEQTRRRIHGFVTLGLLALGSIVFLSYSLNGSNFHQTDITGSMVKAMYLFLPCLAVPFGYAVFASYYNSASLQREIALTKSAIAAGHTRQVVKEEPAQPRKCETADVLRWAILGVAIAFMLYGFFTGGTNDVLTKAINICTECVGLG